MPSEVHVQLVHRVSILYIRDIANRRIKKQRLKMLRESVEIAPYIYENIEIKIK